jgi:hypothetical protein
VVSPVLLVRSLEEVGGSTPVETPYFAQPESQPQGATWQPMTGPHGTSPFIENDAMCQTMIHPRVCRGVCPINNRTTMSLPCQHATVSATSACATCHPYSGDTCHPLTGPNHLLYTLSSATCHLQKLPHQLYSCTTCTVSLPRGTVRTVQSPIFFACLGFRTECDIFRIRSPFDEVNIWPESGRRDRRNGVGFVGF